MVAELTRQPEEQSQARRPDHQEDRGPEEDRPGEERSGSGGFGGLLGDSRLAMRGNGQVQEAMLEDMQQTYGNRAVQRMMGRRGQQSGAPQVPGGSRGAVQRFIQRTAAHKDSATGGVAIQREIGDGHDLQSQDLAGDPVLEATFDDKHIIRKGESGEPVRRLQQGLMDAGFDLPRFGADGQFGNETLTAVRSLQSQQGLSVDGQVGPLTIGALDSLLPSGGGPTPPGPNPQPPDIVPLSPELENIMDHVGLEYQKILKEQNSALVRVERDLRGLEKPNKDTNTLIIDLLKKAAGFVIENLVGGGGLLRLTVASAFKGFSLGKLDLDKFIEKGVNEVFDLITGKSGEAVNSELDKVGQDPNPPPSLEVFIDSQREAITQASFATQEKLINETKPAFREFSNDDVLDILEGRDQKPRETRANNLLKSVHEGVGPAFQKQFNETLEKWDQYEAQEKLGTLRSFNKEGKLVDATNMDKMKGKGEATVEGVLEVEIDPKDVDEGPVEVKGLHIAGQSPETRKKLEERNITIGETNFPRRALGSSGLFGLGKSVKVARNEAGETFEVGSSSGGIDWLKQKSGNDDLFSGIIKVWEEIEPKKLKDVDGGLQGP